jgi:PAS domain S-box-containing protein
MSDSAALGTMLTIRDLHERPGRPPNYQADNAALLGLAEHMASAPQSVLQKLAELLLDICKAGSAGVSLLNADGRDFHWAALAGSWVADSGNGMPRDFSPCGVVLDKGAPELFRNPERFYPYLSRVAPPITEALLAPFFVAGKAQGVLWVISHDDTRFCSDDLLMINSLGRIASAACQRAPDREAPLRDINAALLVSSLRQHELTEYAEAAELAARGREERMGGEFEALQALQKLSNQLIHENQVETLYAPILDAALAIMKADTASIQALDDVAEGPRLLAVRGFNNEFEKFFALSSADVGTASSRARRMRQRVVVSDVESCAFLAHSPALEDMRKAGIRAVQSTPLKARDGRLLGIISTHWRRPHVPAASDLHLLDVLARQTADLIERAQAETRLRDSEERFRMLVEVITDVPWTTNAEGAFIAPQAAWTAYTGQSWEDSEGFGWLDRIHPDDQLHIKTLWDRSLLERTLYRARGRFWHAATTQYRHFDARATPMLDQKQNVREWVGSFTDVEERQRFETTLNDLNSDLKQFAFAASHDLREPLRMVTSYTQLLARDYKGRLDPTADQFIAYVVESALRMETLLSDLLDYWSAREGTVEELGPVDLNSAFEEAVANLDVAIRESGAIVTHELLPTVLAEKVPLVLLLQNLISNALKYRRVDIPPRIHVSARRNAFGWETSVADNGIGIAEEFLEEIFVPFKRLHGREYPGSGLGLAMARKIVERYQGRLLVESIEMQGSTFRFTLT